MGVRLFDRHADGVELTSAGSVVLEHCRQTLFDYRQTMAKVDDIKELRAGHITIVSLDSVADSILPDVLDRFIEEHPQITFSIRMANLTDIVESLADGESDIGISFTNDIPAGLRIHTEKATPIGAIMRKDHPLAERDSLQVSDLASYQLVRSYDGLTEHSLWDRAMEEAKISVPTQAETNSLAFARSMILRNHGIGIYTKIGFLDEIKDDKLIYLPIRSPVLSDLKIGIMTSPRSGSSPAIPLLCRSLSRSLKALRLDS